MKRFKGTVKNNVIVLPDGVHLPEGAKVEVRLASRRKDYEEAFRRVRENPITRPVGIDEIIEEDKREREERWVFEGPPRQ